jgi:transposase InsO family protein
LDVGYHQTEGNNEVELLRPLVILDTFSRYVAGWMITQREEAAELAEQLIGDTAAKQQITPGTLTLHADRGTSALVVSSAMTTKNSSAGNGRLRTTR